MRRLLKLLRVQTLSSKNMVAKDSKKYAAKEERIENCFSCLALNSWDKLFLETTCPFLKDTSQSNSPKPRLKSSHFSKTHTLNTTSR